MDYKSELKRIKELNKLKQLSSIDIDLLISIAAQTNFLKKSGAMFTEKQVEDAYDKGFKDGATNAANDILN